MNKLTPQQKENAKKIICDLIDDEGSCFFFAGTPSKEIKDKAITVYKGNAELLIRSMVSEASRNHISCKHILTFIEHVIHVCRLSSEVVRETFIYKAKNQ